MPQHPTTLFFFQARCPSCHPTNSVKPLKVDLYSGRKKGSWLADTAFLKIHQLTSIYSTKKPFSEDLAKMNAQDYTIVVVYHCKVNIAGLICLTFSMKL